MTDRIALKLIGITYNQVESGVYALILQEEDGDRRLPIIIGYPEAQAIECKMQEVNIARPLTHDLMITLLQEFDLTLLDVWIHRLPNGVFAADLTVENKKGEIRVIDSRSSDGIALAIRAGAPIFTSSQLLDEVGFRPNQNKKRSAATDPNPVATQSDGQKSVRPSRDASQVSFPGVKSGGSQDLSSLPMSVLKKSLQRAVEQENYEKAGEIKKEIDKRNQQI